MKKFRKMLSLGKDIGNPFPQEHEWLYNLINFYEKINKDHVYSLITKQSDYVSIRQDFMISILTETQQYYELSKFKDIHASIEDIISLWRRDPTGKKESAAWSAAESAAWSAAESAVWSAARSAAWSAARSAAEQKQIELITSLIKKHSEKK